MIVDGIYIEFKKALTELLAGFTSFLPRLVIGLGIVMVFVIVAKLFHATLGKRIEKRWKHSLVAGFAANGIRWAIYLIGVIAALMSMKLQGILGGLAAGAGVSAIIIGFAFKDIGENFLAGILMAFNQPFSIGDIIEIEGNKGTVKDLNLRSVHLRNAEGKDIYVPNSMIVKSTLVNYTKDGALRMSFGIGIAPEDNLEKARTVILDYLNTNTKILKTPKPNVVVSELGEFTVDLLVLFWVDLLDNPLAADMNLGHTVRSNVIKDIKAILDEAGISMPSQVLEHKMYRQETLHIGNP